MSRTTMNVSRRPYVRLAGLLSGQAWCGSGRCCRPKRKTRLRKPRAERMFFFRLVLRASYILPLPFEALESGATLLEVNQGETPLTTHADQVLRGPAGDVLLRLIRELSE